MQLKLKQPHPSYRIKRFLHWIVVLRHGIWKIFTYLFILFKRMLLMTLGFQGCLPPNTGNQLLALLYLQLYWKDPQNNPSGGLPHTEIIPSSTCSFPHTQISCPPPSTDHPLLSKLTPLQIFLHNLYQLQASKTFCLERSYIKQVNS